MKRFKCLLAFIFVAVVFFAASPSALACATCFGASDSPMAKGMNWGIFSLLVVIVSLLAAVAGFFIFLARKAAQVSASAESQPLPLETKNV